MIIWDDLYGFNVSFNLLLVVQHDIYTWGDPEVFVKYMSQLVNPLVSWFRPLDPKSNRTSRIPSCKTTFPGCVFIHSFSTGNTSRSKDFCLREFLNCLCKELSISFFPKVRSWGIQYSWWRWVLEFYVPVTYLKIEKNIDTFTGRLSVCEEVTDLKYETLLFHDTKPSPNHSFWGKSYWSSLYTEEWHVFCDFAGGWNIFLDCMRLAKPNSFSWRVYEGILEALASVFQWPPFIL